MHYHLIVTNRCNLNCRYCGGSRDVLPGDLDYSLDELAEFLKDDNDPVINFYGGEPLLRPDIVEEVMDQVDARYVIQTNGLLFEDLDPDHIKRFHTILLSLDGGREITDSHRAPGVYDKVVNAARYVRDSGFTGDLVARMTVSTDADIYKDAIHLAYTGIFDHIHWQLDFEMFWEGGKDLDEVESWMETSYEPGITKLIDRWVIGMIQQRDLGFVPFIVLAKGMLDGRKGRLGCGSGLDFWGITTEGKLTACPVNLEDEKLMVGDIFTSTPANIEGSIPVTEPCPSCDIYDFCGGRCLLINHNQEGVSQRGWELMCRSVRYLKKELDDVFIDVKKMYMRDKFVKDVLDYPEFNNSTEIMP
jgi:putative peptide-modifying radical SAM enzyme